MEQLTDASSLKQLINCLVLSGVAVSDRDTIEEVLWRRFDESQRRFDWQDNYFSAFSYCIFANVTAVFVQVLSFLLLGR